VIGARRLAALACAVCGGRYSQHVPRFWRPPEVSVPKSRAAKKQGRSCRCGRLRVCTAAGTSSSPEQICGQPWNGIVMGNRQCLGLL